MQYHHVEVSFLFLQAETQDIREKLFTVLEEKRRKLKEDKDNCDLAYGKKEKKKKMYL